MAHNRHPDNDGYTVIVQPLPHRVLCAISSAHHLPSFSSDACIEHSRAPHLTPCCVADSTPRAGTHSEAAHVNRIFITSGMSHHLFSLLIAVFVSFNTFCCNSPVAIPIRPCLLLPAPAVTLAAVSASVSQLVNTTTLLVWKVRPCLRSQTHTAIAIQCSRLCRSTDRRACSCCLLTCLSIGAMRRRLCLLRAIHFLRVKSATLQAPPPHSTRRHALNLRAVADIGHVYDLPRPPLTRWRHSHDSMNRLADTCRSDQAAASIFRDA